MSRDNPKPLVYKDRARQLRKKMTPSEAVLWEILRAKRLDGFKFKRQQQIAHFIVDFICFSQNVIIEVDGPYHQDQADYDSHKTESLMLRGYRVLRFTNDDVLEDPTFVAKKIIKALKEEEL